MTAYDRDSLLGVSQWHGTALLGQAIIEYKDGHASHIERFGKPRTLAYARQIAVGTTRAYDDGLSIGVVGKIAKHLGHIGIGVLADPFAVIPYLYVKVTLRLADRESGERKKEK